MNLKSFFESNNSSSNNSNNKSNNSSSGNNSNIGSNSKTGGVSFKSYNSDNNGLFQNAASSLVAGTNRFIMKLRTATRTGSNSSNGNSSNGNVNKKQRSPPAGEEEFEKLLADAEYEAFQDPYRGLKSGIQSRESGTQVTTPWNACVWGTLQPEQCVPKESLDSVAMVRHVGNCACPTLKAWTRKLQDDLASKQSRNKKKSRKRQRSESESGASSDPVFLIGLRPKEENYRCPCDYNPLCLGTLGGAVNDILKERCETMEVSNAKDEELAGVIRVKEEPGDTTPPIPKPTPKNSNHSGNNATPTKSSVRPDQVIINVDGEGDSKDQSMSEMSEDETKERDDAFTFPGTPQAEQRNVQSTPLQKNRRPLQEELPTGDPSDVFFQSNNMTQEFKVTYSSNTSNELKRLRSSIDLSTADIRSYVFRTLHVPLMADGKDQLTLDEYMKILSNWHKSLLFVNPVNEERFLPDDKITLSIPPGIENLGATCYLNTQLQCLAQNTVFLNGIFSWRLVNNGHRMNSVMTSLQHLLAQMLVGGDSRLSTLNFSNALGLEHDEQQDPNEFARLLFERMDESFQQCAGDLANLLKRIFHGTTTYETVCMECGNTSERSEGFMDINLPIVKRPKKGDIKSAFEGGADTDVQYCLDQYVCEEILNEDNQYFCSACDCKRDATRALKLTELPPVLNVQLSRYVFDREQFVKKKLSDKVLLPRTLYINHTAKPKKYLLCAVMRHQGTSAYRGHYVAEAMDWLTGQWFEFNDARVKLLPDGPSCSFDPDKDEAGPSGVESPSGSQDAYNMYYVSEKYLAKRAVEAIQRRGLLGSSDESNESDILKQVSRERDEKYARLSSMCFEDGLNSDRLQRRKLGIRRYMLNDASSLLPEEHPPNGSDSADAPIWVESNFLRDFLRCDGILDGELKSPGPMLKHQHLLCEHKCLHPRTAREGKVLSRIQYNAYISLIQAEREVLKDRGESEYEGGLVNDCEISLSYNLFCGPCADSYREELSTKLCLLRSIKDLYDAFEAVPEIDPIEILEGQALECEEDGFAYAVARQSVTKYKKIVSSLLKTFQKHDEGIFIDDFSMTNSFLHLHGLDGLDLSIFLNWRSGDKDEQSKLDTKMPSEGKPTQLMDYDLDKFVNTTITCSHGNCNVMNNLRIVRFFPWKVWQTLKNVFPYAIEHKKKRQTPEAAQNALAQNDLCAVCQGEKENLERLKNKLMVWAKETRQNFELKELMDGKRTVSRDLEVHNFTCAKNGCRLVHRVDIQTWRKALTSISNNKVKGTDIMQLIEFVENAVFPNYHSVVLDFERQPVERLLASLRSLICREHRRVIKSAVFKDCPEIDEDASGQDTSHQLSDCIAVLSDVEYRAYVSSLADLLHILYPDDTPRTSSSVGSPAKYDEDKPYLADIVRITNSYHPAINMRLEKTKKSTDDLLIFSLHKSSKEFQLTPGVCSCHTCSQEFAPLLHRVNFEDDDKIESISLDSNDAKIPPKKLKGKGSVRSDPIVVEQEGNDYQQQPSPNSFTLRTFEIKEKSSTEESLKHLQSISALSNENESPGVNFLRRSSRKRQSRYPNGPLLREDTVNVGMHHNIAALRLLMYEKCEVPLEGKKMTLVISLDDGTTHEMLTLRSEHNQQCLSDLVKKFRPDSDKKGDWQFDPSKHLLLFFQHEHKFDTLGLHEPIMDSFLQMANLDNNGTEGSKKNKKRNRPSERGFRGTLLQSSPLPTKGDGIPKNGEKSQDDVDKMNIQKEREAKKLKSSTIQLNISEISDEDDIVESGRKTQQQGAGSSEISDDEDKGDATNKKVVNGQFENAEVRNSAQIIMEDDSLSDNASINNVEVLYSTYPRANDVADTSIDGDSSPDFRSKYRRIFEHICSTVEPPADESLCWDAIKLAVDVDPNSSESQVLDLSLAYYLERMG